MWFYLGNSDIEVAESIKHPLLPLDCYKELLDTLQCQLVTLHQDADRVRHELAGHLQDLVRQCSRDQAHLNYLLDGSTKWFTFQWQQRTFLCHLSGRRKISVDVIDLLLETLVQHLIGLVQHQLLDALDPQGATTDHVNHSTGGARDNVLLIVQLPDVLTKVGATNARMTLHIHVVPKCKHHLTTGSIIIY